MRVSIVAVDVVEVKAETPGDMAGSGIRVDIALTNESPEKQSVESAVVTMTTNDGLFAIPTIAGGAEHLSGDVGPGQTASGRYVFLLDNPTDHTIVVDVNYGPGEPVASFIGKVS